MLDSIIGIMSSGGVGAIVGVLGGFLTKIQEAKLEKIRHKNRKDMRELDLKELMLEQKQQVLMIDKNIDLAEAEGNLKVDLEEAVGFSFSQKDGGSWMDIAKSLMRPVLTLYIIAFSTYIFYVIHQRLGGFESLPVDDLMEIYKHIIMQVIFLSVLGFSWWFAARPSSSRRLTRAERNT